MTLGYNAGNFTIAASASVSNIIDTGGATLVGLDFPAGGTGAGFYLKEGPNDSSSGGNLFKMYQPDGTQIGVITATVDSSSATVASRVRFAPDKIYAMRNIQLCASSSQSSAVTVRPVWAPPLAK